jgi:hypothetical protein
MATNLERFKKDLKKLLDLGTQLEHAMLRDVWGKDTFDEAIKKQLGKVSSPPGLVQFQS